MIKTFDQAVKFLEQYIPTPEKKHPGELGLARMKYLMDLLDNPQLKYPTIHVGGTSGKGSTATIIASILATKYRVGLHTSPHLVRINERIKILGNIKYQISNIKDTYQKSNIKEDKFIELLNSLIPVIKTVEKSELGPPSYFEIVTAMAFLYFYMQKVDIAVIEVGMGGRFDATNVIKPLVAVITNVGLDHTEILGDTVEKIAEDKAGIIKSGIQVVSGVRQPSVIEIISAKCNPSTSLRARVQNAKLNLLNKDFNYEIKSMGEKWSVFDYKGTKLFKKLKLRLLGKYQVENAALAIRVVEILNESAEVGHGFFAHPFDSLRSLRASLPFKRVFTLSGSEGLKKHGLPADSTLLRKGLESAFIPGRLEIVSRNPLVILDGAHNPDKVRALVTSIKKIFPRRKIISIIAIKNDKNAKNILTKLLKLSKKIIFTKFELTADVGVISSYEPQELLRVAEKIDQDKPMLIIKDAKKALEEAIKSAKRDDLILVTGSLYLVGEVRKFLISND